MYRLLRFLLLLLFPLCSLAQPGDKIRKGDKSGKLINDSSLQQLRRSIDSMNAAMEKLDSERYKASYQPPAFDPAPLLELQKEMKARQKRQALIRIAIGLGFFAVLVIGLLRQRKRNAGNKAPSGN